MVPWSRPAPCLPPCFLPPVTDDAELVTTVASGWLLLAADGGLEVKLPLVWLPVGWIVPTDAAVPVLMPVLVLVGSMTITGCTVMVVLARVIVVTVSPRKVGSAVVVSSVVARDLAVEVPVIDDVSKVEVGDELALDETVVVLVMVVVTSTVLRSVPLADLGRAPPLAMVPDRASLLATVVMVTVTVTGEPQDEASVLRAHVSAAFLALGR